MTKQNLLFTTILFFTVTCLFAQSLTGVSGLLNAPSANMQKDGTFYMGANYLNRNYINKYVEGKFNCLIYYFDLTFLPFLEVNFRSTRELNNPQPGHTVDRMFSGRLQVLKERKYRPSIVIGGNDVLTTASEGNQYFSAAYIVATKNIDLKKNQLGATLGYAYPLFRNNQFSGIFGGLSFSPFFFRQFSIMAEFDSRNFNVGGSVLFFKHLYVFALLQGMNCVSGGITFKMQVFSGFKGMKRKKEISL